MKHEDPVYENEHGGPDRSDPDYLDRVENEAPNAELATSNRMEAVETSRQLMPIPGKNVLSFYDTEQISKLLESAGFTLSHQLDTARRALDLALNGDPDTETKASASSAIKVLEFVNTRIIERAAEQYVVQRAARQSSTTTETSNRVSADELLRGVQPKRQLPEAALDGVSHAFEPPKQEQRASALSKKKKGSRTHEQRQTPADQCVAYDAQQRPEDVCGHDGPDEPGQ